MLNRAEFEALAAIIFAAALEVHKHLGPGLLESVYQHTLLKELLSRGLNVQCQVPIALYYKGSETGKQFFVDMMVENEIIIEIKAVEGILPVHEAQLLSYLKLADKRLGFLINFNVPLIKDGFKRKVNNYFPASIASWRPGG